MYEMGKKVLIIEDESHISKLVRVLLEKKGYEVSQAFLGEEGIAKAKAEMPDLIILDVMMPKMDGFEVARKLSSGKATKSIPLLMLSSAAQYKDRIKGMESGAWDYLTKPFDNHELIKKVEEYLR